MRECANYITVFRTSQDLQSSKLICMLLQWHMNPHIGISSGANIEAFVRAQNNTKLDKIIRITHV